MAQTFQKAAWIWRQGEVGKDEYCDFLDTVTVSDTSKRIYLSIAADSNYAVWINGSLCTFGQYADYPSYKVYDRVDITDALRAGDNRFVAVVWYYGIDSQTYIIGDAGLIYEVTDEDGTVLACSGTHTLSRLSRDYICGREELISRQLGPTYHYDMRGDDGFRVAGGEGFAPSRLVPTISTDCHLRPNKKLTLEERLPATVCRMGGFRYTTESGVASHDMQYAAITGRSPIDMIKTGDVRFSAPTKLVADDPNFPGVFFIVDLGAETAGFLDIDLELPADCRIDVGYGEHLDDGICRTAVRGFSCDIQARAGRNTYLNTFRRFGCRYLQFFVHASEVTVHYAGMRPTLYPLQYKAYKTGNLLRETIYKVCQDTLQHCLHEHYEDCPWREQALYTMDSRNQMLCGYYAFGETQAPRAALELISHGMRPDGLLTLCYPAGRDAPIPAFSCMYFVQMEEYIRYTGDTTLAAQAFPVLTRICETFAAKRLPEGIIENFHGIGPSGTYEYWNFYEWSPSMSGRFNETERRLECPLNCFYSLALQSMSKICGALGKNDEAARYRAEADALNAFIVSTFYNEETKLFNTFAMDEEYRNTYSVLTQSLCMLCGAAKGVDTSVMLSLMANNGGQIDGLTIVPNTLSMNSFRFDALLIADKDTYAPVILSELDREYLRMLRAGATTFWETAIGAEDFDGAGSLCHGWSALPIYYYELLDPAGN